MDITTDTKTDVNINFSDEELFVILNFLEISVFAGLDMQAINTRLESQQDILVEIVQNGLIARKVMARNKSGELKLDPFVLAVIGTCAIPDRSVFMIHNLPNKPSEGYFFHTSDTFTILHKNDSSSIHKFYMLRDVHPISTSITNILNLDKAEQPNCPSGKLSESLMAEAKNAALTNGEEDADKVLERSHMDIDTQSYLAKTLAQAKSFTTVAQIVHQKDDAHDLHQGGFTLLYGAGLLWVAQPADKTSDNESNVTIVPISAKKVHQQIAMLVNEV